MPKVDLLSLHALRRRGAAIAVVVVVFALASIAIGGAVLAVREPVVPPDDSVSDDPGSGDIALNASSLDPIAAGRVPPAAATKHPDVKITSKPIERWLSALAEEAGVGLLLAPGVAGTEVVASFSPGTDWRRRLEAVARLNGLTVRHEDGLIEVARAPVAAEPVAIQSVTTQPVNTATAAGGNMQKPYEPRRSTRLLRLTNARAADLVTALDGPLSAGGVTAGYDAGTNSLVLGGPEEQLADAVRLAVGLDIPRRRFLLEAHIVELSRSARHEMGVQWTLESNDLGSIVNFPSAAGEGEGSSILVATSGSHSLRARLSALESSGRVRVISRPRIVVVEGKPASIEAVRILRVRLPDRGAVVADGDSAVAVDAGRAFEEIRVGVSLQVEPSLQGEGNVVLRIIAKSSTLGPPSPPDDIPEELSRRVEADVVVADGQTAVLGGMLRENSSRSGTGVPVLRSLPLVGALFGRSSRERDVEELIVLVTPHLIP